MKRSTYGWFGIGVVGMGTVLLVTDIPGPTAQDTGNPTTTAVTVYGTSSLSMTPSRAVISLGVMNQAASAGAALTANNRVTTRIIHAIEHLGVTASAIATSGLNINPNYNQANPPDVTGYQVTDTLNITVPEHLAGTVIDTGVKSGANQVNGINVSVPQDTRYRRSYRLALHDAASQAAAIAASLHERVAGVKSVTVDTQNPGPIFALSTAAANTPVMPGQQQTALTLKVVYRLR